jgi:restriction endonuclease
MVKEYGLTPTGTCANTLLRAALSIPNLACRDIKAPRRNAGIDGSIYFKPDGKVTERAIVSVKGGANVGVPMIRDLGHVVDRQKAKIGIFITLAEPTKPMIIEAVAAGFYKTEHGKFPKLQILTIQELFDGAQPKLPWTDPNAFKKAAREALGVQPELGLAKAA